jgi:hypothetical protein
VHSHFRTTDHLGISGLFESPPRRTCQGCRRSCAASTSSLGRKATRLRFGAGQAAAGGQDRGLADAGGQLMGISGAGFSPKIAFGLPLWRGTCTHIQRTGIELQHSAGRLQPAPDCPLTPFRCPLKGISEEGHAH